MAEVSLVRRGLAAFAGGTFGGALCLVVLAVPAKAVPAGGLPGPAPDCPAERGAAAPDSTPWAQQALSFSSVWNLTGGAGVTVAVVDSGVDFNPQFGGRVTLGPDLAGENVGTPAGADCLGHGTSVASIIAAAPMAGVSFAGVAPQAAILSIKITNSETFADDVTPRAIRDAVDLGANVINLSLGTTDNSRALRSAVEFALASNVVTPPGRFTRTLAMSVTAGAVGLAAVVAGAAVVLPAGRRRRWRPGRTG